MKKLILSSIVLLIFSLSIVLFQISCKKDATAQPRPLQSDIILIQKVVPLPTLHAEYWLVNLDGSNLRQIPISLPAGYSLGDGPKLTPDGSTIVFPAVKYMNTDSSKYYIYKCQIDGSNITEVLPSTNNTLYNLVADTN